MKSLKLSLLAAVGAFFFVSTAATAQTTAKAAPAAQAKNMTPSAISWKEDVHNFGEIEKSKPVSHEFSFTNTTKETVLITKVKPSCGCTATNYTKTPIKPGETGTVTATYNAAAPGNFTKTVKVNTNDSDVVKVLTIKGKVVAAQ